MQLSVFSLKSFIINGKYLIISNILLSIVGIINNILIAKDIKKYYIRETNNNSFNIVFNQKQAMLLKIWHNIIVSC